jgi:hypothetical protein
MTRIALIAAATICTLGAVSLPAQRAHAAAFPIVAVPAALGESSLIENVRYVCRNWCGVGGCYRKCWWEPRRHLVYRPYRWRRHRP